MEQPNNQEHTKFNKRVVRITGTTTTLAGVLILGQKDLHTLMIPGMCSLLIGLGITWKSFEKEE